MVQGGYSLRREEHLPRFGRGEWKRSALRTPSPAQVGTLAVEAASPPARLTSAPSGDLAESPKSLQFLSDLVKGSDSTPSWGGAPGWVGIASGEELCSQSPYGGSWQPSRSRRGPRGAPGPDTRGQAQGRGILGPPQSRKSFL